jgi:hypothetical protein
MDLLPDELVILVDEMGLSAVVAAGQARNFLV